MELTPFKFWLLAGAWCLMALPALAQDKPGPDAECAVSRSEIMPLRAPQFGAVYDWDIIYAEAGMDMFSDAVPLENGGIVAGGAYTKDKKDPLYHPLLVKFDEDQKKVWEVRAEGKMQQSIVRMVKTKAGFTVLGDIIDPAKGAGIYIASYDEDGKIKGEALPMYETGGSVSARAFVPANDGSGYLIAAQFIDAKNQDNQSGMLFKVSREGKLLWKRSYKPSRASVFNNIQTMLDGSYAVTGQLVMDNNTSGGWLLRLDNNGAISWQKTFPRGAAASLQSATLTKDGHYILTGKARPTQASGPALAAWVMKTDLSGNPVWQRFFKGAFSYQAPEAVVYEDGRASVLIEGGALDGEHQSHVRLATFSPMGLIQKLEDYTEGKNATSHRLISGLNGERIFVGYTQTSFGDDQEKDQAAPVYTYDAWIIAAPALDLYENPCDRTQSVSPILP